MNCDNEYFAQGINCEDLESEELSGWDSASISEQLRYSMKPISKNSKSFNDQSCFGKNKTKIRFKPVRTLCSRPTQSGVFIKKSQILRGSLLPKIQCPMVTYPINTSKLISSLASSYKKCNLSLREPYKLTSKSPQFLIRRANKY